MSTRARIGIILAAGKGTRLKSDLAKVLHPVLGKPMLVRVLESLLPLGLDKVIIVVGHQATQVQETLAQYAFPFKLTFVTQEPQLGTGHALMQVLPVVPAETPADVLITCGDMPLIPTIRYQQLAEAYYTAQVTASLVTVAVGNPKGYGRVLSQDNRFERIVEEKDATNAEKQVNWINAGIYMADWPVFSQFLSRLDQNNAQGEFYLTDVLGLIVKDSEAKGVSTVVWPSEEEVLGINSRAQLSQASDILSRWTIGRLMDEGVSFINPQSSTVAPEVSIGPDTVVQPGCFLEGNIHIGRHCDIGPHTTMRGEIRVGDNTRVVYTYIDKAVQLGSKNYIGPYTHLRDNAVIGDQVRIGNFVEVKETNFGSRSNAAHLCYLGDADVGNDVNMGAGSITANYDPVRDKKYRTVIKDGVKVGCNSVLIAPVELGEHCSVAAGSVITHSVASLDLAIARGRQTEIHGWVQKVLDAENEAQTSNV